MGSVQSTSSAHTAGPWRIEPPLLPGGPNYEIMTDSGTLICELADHDEEAHSNARLIAAAPDLLSRCKMGLEDAEFAIANPDKITTANWRSIADDLRTVIAKAEGRA